MIVQSTKMKTIKMSTKTTVWEKVGDSNYGWNKTWDGLMMSREETRW